MAKAPTGDDIVASRERQREAERQKNRAAGPNLAALMDEMRDQFPGAKMVWGKDLVTGFEVGKNPDEIDPDKVFRIPENYFPSRQISTKKETKK